MKKFTLIFALLLVMLCGTTAKAVDWTVGNRVVSLTVGNYYAIYNACANDHYGKFWLYDNGTSIGATMVSAPIATTVFDLEKKHVWQLESGETSGTYRLKNFATGQYVDLLGKTTGHTESLDLYIALTPTSGSDEYGGDVLNASGTNAGEAGKYTGGDVFYITAAVDGKNWTSGWESGFEATGNGAQAHAFYNVDEATLEALQPYNTLVATIADAKRVLGTRGVGYPMEGSTEYFTLDAAIKTAENINETDVTDSHVATLNGALTAYKSATANVQLPEDGKAYAIYAIFPNGNRQAMYWDGSRITTKLDETAIPFVCRVTAEGKFVLVNNNGGYLSWFSDEKGYAPNVGVTDEYIVVGTKAYNDLTITRATVEKTSGNILDGTTNEDFFGRVHIQGVNNDESGSAFYLAARRDDGAFIAGNPTDKWYDNNWNGDGNQRTVTFAIEEIEDFRNAITFNELGGDQPKVATYSAPFPTLIPKGVRAYAITGSKTAEGEEVATTQELEGSVIPANTGVLLASDNLASVAMTPAADEGVGVAPEGNLLHATGGTNAEVTVESGKTAFILANPAAGLGFYPLSNNVVASYRAYLVLDNSAQAVKLVFGGNVTGIEAVETTEADDAPIYDLSGRRVLAPAKGGIYVKNGKKIIF